MHTTGAAPLILLASSSASRRELLARLKLSFSVAVPHVDERPLAYESPRETALRLAEAKARSLSGAYPNAVIIGSDQVAVLAGRVLGKPGTYDAALAQLLAARGGSVVFHTAACVLDAASGAVQVEEVPTTVRFRRYSEAQAARYLSADRPFDCAGSAKIETLGIALVECVESSDPTALVGLPLIALVSMLGRVGIEVP